MKPTLLLHDIVREIRAVSAGIWLLQKFEFSLVLRCEYGIKQFLIVLPPITGEPVVLPTEKTPSHLVNDLSGLREWLRHLISSQNING